MTSGHLGSDEPCLRELVSSARRIICNILRLVQAMLGHERDSSLSLLAKLNVLAAATMDWLCPVAAILVGDHAYSHYSASHTESKLQRHQIIQTRFLRLASRPLIKTSSDWPCWSPCACPLLTSVAGVVDAHFTSRLGSINIDLSLGLVGVVSHSQDSTRLLPGSTTVGSLIVLSFETATSH